MNIFRNPIRLTVLPAALAAIAGCTADTPPPQPAPPPPPPPVVYVPPRPTPPMGAVGTMTVPMMGADGIRRTVNANLTPAQTTWNLRSALNVAALNCLDAEHVAILDNYKVFLKDHARSLSATNRALASEFRQKYGATYRDVQDSYMTQVYNYFALPPANDAFCDMSLAVSNELRLVKPGELDTFSAMALPRIEGVFENFFRAYEQYRIDLAAWDARYGPPAVTTTATGYVNPLDPTVTVPAGETTVGTMPAHAPQDGTAPVMGAPASPPASSSGSSGTYGPSEGEG